MKVYRLVADGTGVHPRIAAWSRYSPLYATRALATAKRAAFRARVINMDDYPVCFRDDKTLKITIEAIEVLTR